MSKCSTFVSVIATITVLVCMTGCDDAGGTDAAGVLPGAAAGSDAPVKAAGLARVMQPLTPETIAQKRGTEKLLDVSDGLECAVAHAPIETLVEVFRNAGRTQVNPVPDPNHVRVDWAPWSDQKTAVVLLQFKGQSWTEVIAPDLDAQKLSDEISARVITIRSRGWYGGIGYEMWTSGQKMESYQGHGDMPFRSAEHGSDWRSPAFYSAYRDLDFKTIRMTDGQFIHDFVKSQGAYMGLCTMQPDYMGDRDASGKPSLKLTWPRDAFPPGVVERAYILYN